MIPRTQVKAFTLTPQVGTVPVTVRPTANPETGAILQSTDGNPLSGVEESGRTLGGDCSGTQPSGVVY